MCGQSVSRRKVEVAVLTADKVVGWCVNANALPKGVSDAFHVRRAAMKHGECLEQDRARMSAVVVYFYTSETVL